jgi:G protein-coupled receptor GPR1
MFLKLTPTLHSLIMLLIQSDMFKAFWLMVPPVAYFIQGPVDSSDTICQISGFLLNSAIEASDIAVLMIAFHSALYILKSGRPDGDAGLYPYRRWAYAAWFVIPLILTAIVPATGGRFENVGSVCYLPTTPLWYRTALSWGPRYVIFFIIIFTYSALYWYLFWKFRNLEKAQRRASMERRRNSMGTTKEPKVPPIGEVPPTPAFAHHGLLDIDRPRASIATDEVVVPQSAAQTPECDRVDKLHLDTSSAESAASESQGKSERAHGSSSLTEKLEPNSEPDATQGPKGRIDSQDQTSATATRPLPRRPLSAFMFQQDMRRAISIPENQDHEHSNGASIYLTQSVTGDVLHQSRRNMRRQLRLLFVYPLMYMITWIAPFVSNAHRLRPSENDNGNNQPYELIAASTASLCISAAVDCCFFIAWEKPWRDVRGSFWEGLLHRLRIRRVQGMVGRTRDEQSRDARTALRRRTREATDLATAATQRRSTRGTGTTATREWWDAERSRPASSESERD